MNLYKCFDVIVKCKTFNYLRKEGLKVLAQSEGGKSGQKTKIIYLSCIQLKRFN